jgi:hypothetical protein
MRKARFQSLKLDSCKLTAQDNCFLVIEVGGPVSTGARALGLECHILSSKKIFYL